MATTCTFKMFLLNRNIQALLFISLFSICRIEAKSLTNYTTFNNAIDVNTASFQGDSMHRLVLIKTIKGDFKDFSIDNLGNLYLIFSTNQIKKLDTNLDSVAIFNDTKRFGDLYTIDVSNPLKVLVFYKDFATVLMLDRQLNIKNVIDLRQQNIFQVAAISQSNDNNVWLFDEVEYKLKKIDNYGKLLMETPDFRLLFNDSHAFIPKYIIDNNNLLYLYHQNVGWKVFDYYGGFKTQYSFPNWTDVSVVDGFLKGHDQNNFFAERPKDLQSFKFTTNVDLKRAKKILVKQNIYYFLTKDGVEIYNSL